MAEKELNFEVRIKDWDTMPAVKKCIINDYLKRATVSVTGWYTDNEYESCYYRLDIQSRRYYSDNICVGYYDGDNHISWSIEELPTGLIKHSDLEVLAIEDRYENLNAFADLEIVPTIDGNENTDDTARPLNITEEYDTIELDCSDVPDGEPEWDLRTSSFGMKFNNTIKGVYYKLAILPLADGATVDSIKSLLVNNSGMLGGIDLWGDSGKGNSYAFDVTGREAWYGLMDEEVDCPLILIAGITADDDIVGLLYMQLCFDENGSAVTTLPDTAGLISLDFYINPENNWEPVFDPELTHMFRVPLLITDRSIESGNIPTPAALGVGQSIIDY